MFSTVIQNSFGNHPIFRNDHHLPKLHINIPMESPGSCFLVEWSGGYRMQGDCWLKL